MQTMRRAAILAVVAATVFGLAAAVATAGSNGPFKLRGTSVVVDEDKGISRTDGSLIGTWQTTSFKTIAEGLTQTAGVSGAPYEYAAAGTELFTGCHDRNANKRCEAAEKGTLKFTFTYWGTFDPESGTLIKAQCQHPVVGGTGAFKQARGVVYMNDRPTASGVVTVYSGTLAYASAVGRSLSSVGAAKGCGRSS